MLTPLFGRPIGQLGFRAPGDSLEDVRTGREGGAHVIAVASGTTDAGQVAASGADRVFPDLAQTRLLRTAIHR